jgi:sugar lactone lactonase YvrE
LPLAIQRPSGDQVYLFAADGSEERAVRARIFVQNDEGGLCWSADGKSILVATTEPGGSRLDRIDAATGRQVRVAALPPELALRGPAGFLQAACLDPVTGAYTTTARTLKSDLWILDGFPALRRF